MNLIEIFTNPNNLVSLLTLTFLKIVLGVDNIIFVSIVVNKLPAEMQRKARNLGLLLAMVFRLILLLFIGKILALSDPLFAIDVPFFGHGFHHDFSIKDLILLGGGLFLLAKSITEIHHKLEGHTEDTKTKPKSSFGMVLVEIAMVNIVFSFDSILTAIGLTDIVPIMMVAVVVSMLVMMAFANAVSQFINKHPTLQMLALSFLILIGIMLIAEATGAHVDKGYLYFGIAFSLGVELLNMRFRKKHTPVQLHGTLEDAQNEDENVEGFMEENP